MKTKCFSLLTLCYYLVSYFTVSIGYAQKNKAKIELQDSIQYYNQWFEKLTSTHTPINISFAQQGISFAQRNKIDTLEAHYYGCLAEFWGDLGQFDSCLAYNHNAENILKRTLPWGLKKLITLKVSTASKALIVGAYPITLEYTNSALTMLRNTHDSKYLLLEARILAIQGQMFGSIGDYAQAIHYFLAAEALLKKFPPNPRLTNSLSEIYSFLSNSYNYIHDYKNALLYAKKTYWLLQKLSSTEAQSTLAEIYETVGVIHSEQGELDSAFFYIKKAIEIVQKDKTNKLNRNTTYLNLGEIYRRNYQYDSALKYFNYSLVYLQKSDKNNTLSNKLGPQIATYVNIAHVYLSLTDLTKATEASQKALQLANRFGNNYLKQITYEILYLIEEKKKNWTSAYQFHKKYIEYSEILSNEEQNRIIARAETRYELEQEIEEQKTQAAQTAHLAAEALEERNNLQYLGIGSVLALLLATIFLFGYVQLNAPTLALFTFITLILIFEFILLVLESFQEKYTQGEPFLIFIMNAGVALLLTPLHRWAERRFRLKRQSK